LAQAFYVELDIERPGTFSLIERLVVGVKFKRLQSGTRETGGRAMRKGNAGGTTPTNPSDDRSFWHASRVNERAQPYLYRNRLSAKIQAEAAFVYSSASARVTGSTR